MTMMSTYEIIFLSTVKSFFIYAKCNNESVFSARPSNQMCKLVARVCDSIRRLFKDSPKFVSAAISLAISGRGLIKHELNYRR